MSKRAKREKRPVAKIDFKPYGAAIKAERMKLKESRNKVGSEMFLSPRYIANIENKGQHPSLQVFYELVTLFDISVDQFFFPQRPTEKSTQRRQLDKLLDEVHENDLVIVSDTVKGILKAREAEG